MKQLSLPKWLGKSLWVASGVLFAAACAEDQGPPAEKYGHVSSALFTNGDFELGAAGMPPQSWTVNPFLNNVGVTVASPETEADLNLANGGAGLTTTIAAVGQPDPDLGLGASLRVCRFGNQCARVNFHSSSNFGHAENANVLTQTMTVGAGDVDPSDGQIHVRFAAAPVLQNPGHAAALQPYYLVQLADLTKGTVLYSDFNLSGQAGVAWQKVNAGGANEIDYTDWQLVDISPGAGKIAIGDMVKLDIIASGCQPGGHFGEIYVDGIGPTIPGLFVVGTAAPQVNACNNLTYTLTYHNGGATAQAGVVVDFTTPPSTTFQSIVPPAGAVCVTPGVGTAGTVVCTFTNPLAAGAVGSFTVTVNVTCGSTGTIVEGNYDIKSATESALLGSHVITIIGCTTDADCVGTPGTWCNETAKNCVPTLPNSTPIPTDVPHANPTLNGTCTVQAGALVCTSAVCDPANNECGYKNGDGPCASGAVCQSAICDVDGLCGYKNGDGPCTVANGPVVCRSAKCSQAGTVCIGPGGCTIDADCAAGQWCNESTSTCSPTRANGQPIPSDPPHMNPTLNGGCTVQAGKLTCTSAVCDTSDNDCGYLNGDGPCTVANGGVVCRSQACDPNDLKCGYANGDGPCTIANGPIVCRSGMCSTNLLCLPPGGCNVDTDCAAGNWCNESAHMCTPKLMNGKPVPSDPPHMSPTLNAMCNPLAGTTVCLSGVCDNTNNECGYANGDGPCTPATGGTLCQSGACSTNGTCEPMGGCNVDADCTAGNWCNEAAHMCTPKLPNGQPVPSDPGHNPTLNGTCTQAAGALVCQSGVCDTADNKCGYANGDGPCTVATSTECRSMTCSTNGTCEPMGGCNVDADCPMGNWCNEAQHMCTPQLPNGTPIPSDPPHMNPTITGTCTNAAAMVTCKSGVCDTADNKCGYANGDGPCTGANGTLVCRSAICATTGPNTGKCEGCTMDSQCPMGSPHCDTTTNDCVMCLVDSDCGGPMSGMVCDDTMKDCTMGCRGIGGNGCATGQMCTSTTKMIGQCVMNMTTSTTSSASTMGTGGSTSTASGTGGSSSTKAFAQGHGIFGCTVSSQGANDGPDASPAFLGGFAMLWLASKRRRTRGARR